MMDTLLQAFVGLLAGALPIAPALIVIITTTTPWRKPR